ncbi:MAG: DUF1801 domain-containing protein, partial [Chloroflexi bacterium]|nr:DUF1801 domain-containing protein [Chloroflexota bacterium]
VIVSFSCSFISVILGAGLSLSYLSKKPIPPHNQKNYMSLYLMSIYADEEKAKKFDAEYGASGKKMDRGKACVRFKRADDLPLDVIGNAVAGTPLDAFIKMYQKSRRR